MFTDFLRERFREVPEQTAIVWKDRSYTYSQLLDLWAEANAQLAACGVGPGAVVLLEAADYSPRAVAQLMALIQCGSITVPLVSERALQQYAFAEIAQAEHAVRIDENDNAQTFSLERRATHPLYATLRQSRRPGLILFSSGTSGSPKAAVHDVSHLLEKYRARRHNLRTLAFLHFDHIGGIDTLLYCVSNTSCLVTCDDRSPKSICRAIEQHAVEVLPVTPTFLNLLVVSREYERFDLRSLKYITYGAELMPETTLRRCHAIFPAVTLLQKYGTTEVGTLRSKSKSADSVWVRLGGEGFAARVVDGCLQIKARSSMLGYLNASSPFTEDGWFQTGDRVDVDGEYIRFLGRDTDIINVGGEKVYPLQVENVIQQMDNIADVTVYGERHPLIGQIVCARVVLVRPESRREVARRISDFCRKRLEPYQVPIRIKLEDPESSTRRFKKIRRDELRSM